MSMEGTKDQNEVDPLLHRPMTSSSWFCKWTCTSSRSDAQPECATSEEASSDAVAWSGQFPSRKAGGVAIFTIRPTDAFIVDLLPYTIEDPQGHTDNLPSFRITVTSAAVEIGLVQSKRHKVLSWSETPDSGVIRGKRETFWLSLDPDNRALKYGKGNRMLQRTLLEYDFGREGTLLSPAEQAAVNQLLNSAPKMLELKQYNGPAPVECTIFEAPLMHGRSESICTVTFDLHPLVLHPSPRLLEDQQMLLSDFTQEGYSFPSSLSVTVQTLSKKVFQPCLMLENITDTTGLNLSDAIQHSLETPGLTLHSKVQEKMHCLPAGVAKSSVHLSIALAPCVGASPGPPMTLEILPTGHQSIPHDNAQACGVLRVLKGNMDVLLFDDDLREADDANPLDEVEMDTGDAFWFSPTWYQTHAMRNMGSSFCCYLLARQYSHEDTVRQRTIRFKESSGNVASQAVYADFDFKTMQRLVSAELAEAVQLNCELLEEKVEKETLHKTASMRTEAWVDRTDSAKDYTAYFKDFKMAGECQEASKPHRIGCRMFQRSQTKRIPDQLPPAFLLTSPAIQGDFVDIMWP